MFKMSKNRRTFFMDVPQYKLSSLSVRTSFIKWPSYKTICHRLCSDKTAGKGFMRRVLLVQLKSHSDASSSSQRCLFSVFFRWIYYCHSSKSAGKETGKTHLCAVFSFFRPSSSSFLLLLHFPPRFVLYF